MVTALSEGTATVVATLEDGAIAACDVEILSKSISFEHYDDTELQVYKGNTITLQAETAPVGEPVSWISLNPEIATVSDGVVTGVSVGVAVIQATLTDGSYAQCRVYVQPKEISLNCTNITLYTSDMTTLVAITVPPGEAVTWISMNSQIATVSSDGVVTAVKPGETIIRAIIDDEIYAFCTVTVLERQIALSETRLIMAVEETFDLDAITTPLGQQVLWFTGDSDVAVVNEDGVVCATGLGFTYITASLADMTTVGCYVEVVERELFVDLERNDINEGGTLTISASTIPENRLVVWESSDTSIATVDQNGVVTGIKAGTVTIRAFMPNGPSISVTVYVTIEDGVYYISNKLSNYYLQTKDRKISSFTNVVQALKLQDTEQETSRITQMWRITYLDEGMYTIRPISNVDMCLYADWCPSAWAEPVVICPHAEDDYENVPPRAQWTITMEDKGYVIRYRGVDEYTLKAKGDSAMLNADIIVGSYSEGLRNCHWKLTPVTNVPKGLVLYDMNTGLPADTSVTKYVLPKQKTSLAAMGLELITYPDSSLESCVQYSIHDDMFASINAYGMVTGIIGGETYINLRLICSNSSGGYDIYDVSIPLIVTDLSLGTYYIRNRYSFQYATAGTGEGSNVTQCIFNPGEITPWTVEHKGEGYYTIQTIIGGVKYYLGISQDISVENANVVLCSDAIVKIDVAHSSEFGSTSWSSKMNLQPCQ